MKIIQTIYSDDKNTQFEVFNSLAFYNKETNENISNFEVLLIRLAAQITSQKKDLHKALELIVTKSAFIEYITSLDM